MAVLTPTYAVVGGLNLSNIEASGVTWVLQSVQGWGAPHGTLKPEQKPRQAGAWAGDSFSAGRSIVLTGAVYAPTAALASDALDRLIVAAGLPATPFVMVESGRSRTTTVRRDGDVIETWLNQQAFTYSVQLFAPDPRKFGTAQTGVTNLPTTSGGSQWPEQWPEVWSATTVSGTVSLTNSGLENGPVVLRVDGPVVGPFITHTGASGVATFASSLTLGVGEWVSIDMEKRTFYANGTASRSSTVTSRTWSQFEPGLNAWTFGAVAYNSSAQLTVTATPAWK